MSITPNFVSQLHCRRGLNMPLWTVTGATVFQHYWAHLTPHRCCISELRKDANMRMFQTQILKGTTHLPTYVSIQKCKDVIYTYRQ
jgi:hypothetical protein